VTAAEVSDRVEAWRRSGSLSDSQARRILAADLSPDAKMRIASKVALGTGAGAYTGTENQGRNGAPVSAKHATEALKNVEGMGDRNEAIRREVSLREAAASRVG